ncbi:RNA polymerase sigma factor [Aureibacter tunicatorum]|uniref:RNA polymerase sigma factor (Sigma-70 family) n=1 Tax=Aureibacter tunicatorum TaxID=866807 RepID=A0AAE3XNS5_9BACT|nr:sigma-70 family RNA polymerase sigma factor [Aureibacter tunicatorum]MDR6239857.1 RNA polymerase sigma factor (sigma-70 family) [Aureibacter tunicatorum]BDD04332.1 hypothetical protein AUTU_18150 [Aureibacter tunicatorum]
MKDKDILIKIKNGDERALDYLYQKNYRMIVGHITKNNGSEEEAKDIFQDALIVFWQNAISESFELTSKISTYLYSVSNNLWLKELKRKSKLSHEEKEDSVNLDFEAKERQEIIRNCVNQMQESCQKILSLYYFDGFSMQKIAEILGYANTDTAKTKKYKCKKKLDAFVRSKYKAHDFQD